jgi:shikimate dehydrogenase
VKRYALLGWPLQASLSPAMFNAAFRALGIPAEYALWPVAPEELGSALSALRAGSLAGANVTIPHKEAVREHLRDETPTAAAVGAVNVVTRNEVGALVGDNTDVIGFERVLAGMGLGDGQGRQALVLGAGGAARAVVSVLTSSGYQVQVLNRTPRRALQLLRDFGPATDSGRLNAAPLEPVTLDILVAGADLIVNATPPASGDDAEWQAAIEFQPHHSFVDLVALPLSTPLVLAARRAGALAVGGLPMLVVQAALAFEAWTGQPAPTELMRDAAMNEAERL